MESALGACKRTKAEHETRQGAPAQVAANGGPRPSQHYTYLVKLGPGHVLLVVGQDGVSPALQHSLRSPARGSTQQLREEAGGPLTFTTPTQPGPTQTNPTQPTPTNLTQPNSTQPNQPYTTNPTQSTQPTQPNPINPTEPT